MKIRSKILVALGLLTASTLLSRHASAGGVVNTGGTSGALGGGVFTFSITSGFAGEGIGGVGTIIPTFCLELNEHISLNTNYTATIGTAAILGGQGGPSDPIDAQTAYLYESFRLGNLAGYDGSSDAQNGLQAAIWYIEAEISLATLTSYGGGILSKANTFLFNASSNAVGAGSLDRVRVLNLTDGNGVNLQSELVLLPLPGGAGMAGLGMLAFVRRRRQS